MNIKDLRKISTCLYEIPKRHRMNVPGWIFADDTLIKQMDEKVREQVSNVASLPGIVLAAMAMPDAHWGYGFPIGGVAAFDPDAGGVISVGGVGYDISCGVRALTTGLYLEDIKSRLTGLVTDLYRAVPSGVGNEGDIALSASKLDEVLVCGARWALEHNYGISDDLQYIEDRGVTSGADPACVSRSAKTRQRKQMGTLGAGNHYLEIQYVDKIYDKHAASVLGLSKDSIVVGIHCGSRALGHQIASDYIQIFSKAAHKYDIPIREKELVCAPISSPEGQRYYKAMCCGINCALANRQIIAHRVREVFSSMFDMADVRTLYDVSHNTCKVETHKVHGKEKRLFVHRKGATRSLGPNAPGLPDRYKDIGQPVLIGGTMGTCSYILAGVQNDQSVSWNSACHGAGRSLSRRQALKRWRGTEIIKDLSQRGIQVMCASKRGAAEEAPGAYKDVDLVVDVTERAGLARRVVRLRPVGCVKG